MPMLLYPPALMTRVAPYCPHVAGKRINTMFQPEAIWHLRDSLCVLLHICVCPWNMLHLCRSASPEDRKRKANQTFGSNEEGRERQSWMREMRVDVRGLDGSLSTTHDASQQTFCAHWDTSTLQFTFQNSSYVGLINRSVT